MQPAHVVRHLAVKVAVGASAAAIAVGGTILQLTGQGLSSVPEGGGCVAVEGAGVVG